LANTGPIARGAESVTYTGLGLRPSRPARAPAEVLRQALADGWVQVIGALLFAVAAPVLIRWVLPQVPTPFDSTWKNSIFCTALATVFGYQVLKRLRTHPGVNSGIYVLYAFSLSYAVLGAALLLVRIDYSRYQLLSSYALTLLWFVFVHYAARTGSPMRLAFIAIPGAHNPPHTSQIQWVRITNPEDDLRDVHGVVADLSATHPTEWEPFFARCAFAGLPTYDVRPVSEALTGQVEVRRLSETTVGSALNALIYPKLKRSVDILGALLVLPLFFLIISIAALAIRLDSPGPALFTQTRVGHRGRRFTIYKLRSMVQRAPDDAHFTQENDARVTRVGRFIRKYRIDELPQVVNILKGDMSWIGPRPDALNLAEWYEQEVPFYNYRCLVRPGLTGWAQVNGGIAAELDETAHRLRYDFYYIKYFSFWLDLLVAAKTIWTIFTGFGSR
jgi:lipopolysaccharide/colanic/teichoic acid biosynthesis glycosyltransferase